MVLVAACMPEAGVAPVGGNESIAPAVVAATRDDIIGTYVVKYINGVPPTINIEGYEPTITIGTRRIHFQSQCFYADWTYERNGEAILTEPYYEPGSAMCARALAPGETAIQNSFDKASTIRRTRLGLHLKGGGYQLKLQRLLDQAQSER